LRRQASALYRNREYLQAEALFKSLYDTDLRLGDFLHTGRSLTYIGACRHGLFHYQDALQTWLQARRLSERVADWVNLGSLGVDISSLYFVMGDLDAAAGAAEQALADANRGGFPDGVARAQIQVGIVRAGQGRLEDCAAAMDQAILMAEREGNLTTAAEAWDHYGEELLAHGALADADRALTEAYRLRKLHRLAKLDSSYYNRGRLRLLQGDAASALHLLDATLVPGHHPDSRLSLWALRHTRGQALLALGRTADAFGDFRTALDAARQWRLEVLPADFTRVSSEVQLNQIYSSYIESGVRLYFATGREELARQTFDAAEENRAASLRALQALPGNWREALPPKYWAALAQLHSLEVQLLNSNDAPLREEMRQVRAAVLEMEASAGARTEISSAGVAEQIQKRLPTDTALLSFHLGEAQSFLWAISRTQFRVYALPGKNSLVQHAGRFSSAVRTGAEARESEGRQLYQELFGQLTPAFRDKPRWILALDEQLFHIPFAALVIGASEGVPIYLTERHAIRFTTGALGLMADDRQSWRALLSGRFLGVGDAIYNTADPRWKGAPAQPPSFLPWLASAATTPQRGPVLTRLAGTAAEVESCAQTWNPQPGTATLLEGAAASPERLRSAFSERPSVIHIATHFRQSSTPPHYSMIALALAGCG
jgi:CHAT domain-containing protein